jgi:hypothetical protein
MPDGKHVVWGQGPYRSFSRFIAIACAKDAFDSGSLGAL